MSIFFLSTLRLLKNQIMPLTNFVLTCVGTELIFFWCLKLTFIYNLKTNRRHENHSGRRPENFNLKSSHNDFTKSPVNSSKLIFVWGNSRYLRGSPRPFSGSKAIILVIYNRFLKNIFSRTRSFLNKKYRKKFVINWCHPSWTNQKL